MIFIKKLLLMILCIISFVGCLIGCEDKEKVDNYKVKITLMYGWGWNLKNHQIMQNIYDEFNNRNKDIELICKPFPDARIVIEKANDMFAVGKMIDIISTNGYSYYVDNARQYFRDGKSAIYFNGIWDSDYFAGEEIEKNIGYAAYHSESGKTVSYVSPPSGYVIRNNVDSNKREACIRFLKYMLSDEVQMEIALNTGQVPSNPRVNNDKIKEEYKLLGEGIEVAMNSDIKIRSMSSVWGGAYRKILTKYLPEAYKDEDTYLEMIEGLNKVSKE